MRGVEQLHERVEHVEHFAQAALAEHEVLRLVEQAERTLQPLRPAHTRAAQELLHRAAARHMRRIVAAEALRLQRAHVEVLVRLLVRLLHLRESIPCVSEGTRI